MQRRVWDLLEADRQLRSPAEIAQELEAHASSVRRACRTLLRRDLIHAAWLESPGGTRELYYGNYRALHGKLELDVADLRRQLIREEDWKLRTELHQRDAHLRQYLADLEERARLPRRRISG